MLDHALPDFPGQVQTRELRVALLQLRDDSEGLPIVIESTGVLHQPGQSHFAGMAKWRVPEVMRKADDLNQILVPAERPRQRPADLRNLEGVRQTRAKIVAFIDDEYLGLVFQSAESRRVQHTIAIALEAGAVVGLIVQVGAALGVATSSTVGCEMAILNLLKLLPIEIHVHPSDLRKPSRVALHTQWGEWGSNPHGVTTGGF